MKYPKVQEETLKNKVAYDFFAHFDCTEIIEKIDFTVKSKKAILSTYFLWAEAKADSTDIAVMLAQLILTIGKARTFDKIPPPPFLGCFDREKIAFIPYHAVQEIFYKSDFNWKVTPSNHTTREFKEVHERVKNILYSDTGGKTFLFNFQKDEKELKQFIHDNFIIGKSETTKIQIDKNNFVSIYIKWLEMVKPTITMKWELVKKAGIIDGDFYLADLLSAENKTLKEKLYVILDSDHYILDRKYDEYGFLNIKNAFFSDQQKAHNQFWAIYERPPLEEYWDYIIERRDLLVPQDIRERKGSFFTPRIWVELSQKYIADVLGENWQDEYYVWDCAAGTGNLLAGLTNKYNIWASTLDKADVDVMHQRIDHGANLLKDQVFQFDFLNDDFDKLPKGLQNIINDEKKRKKLVIYINPPYAESASAHAVKGKKAVEQSKIHDKYSHLLSHAQKELSAQFLARIYLEIPRCTICEFSKVKILQSPRYDKFRSFFRAKLIRSFVVHANTFDNVKGLFPIGFKIWNTGITETYKCFDADVLDNNGMAICKKKFWAFDDCKLINQWSDTFGEPFGTKESIATLVGVGNDFQQQNVVFFDAPYKKVIASNHNFQVTNSNLLASSVYFAVRKVIPADWLNDRDQFLFPNDGWQVDIVFQSDCFTYALFHNGNTIKSQFGVNHWIPFTENEVQARTKFESNFMTDFISGKIESSNDLLTGTQKKSAKALVFSSEAKAVFEAGRELWRYYHSLADCNVNASLYDIREHFQGRNSQGRMNAKSDDAAYTGLIGNLRSALKILAMKIAPKVYEYGFLKE